MQIGVIGLGRMGGNIARRLMENDNQVVVYDRDSGAVKALQGDGAVPAARLDKLVEALRPPRAVWVMLPAGKITEETIVELTRMLAPGDIIIDGGNTFWKDDVRRAKMLKERAIHYVDVGTSGGVWGLERGYCMMIGGEKEIVERLDPLFKALAPGSGNSPRTPGRDGRDPRPELGYIHCEEAVSADVLSAALYARFRSRRDHSFAEKILSAMRKGFGAHVEPKVEPKAEPKDRKVKPS